MTVKEIKEKVEQIKNRLFLMNMIDRWTIEDERTIEKMEKELKELEMAIA